LDEEGHIEVACTAHTNTGVRSLVKSVIRGLKVCTRAGSSSSSSKRMAAASAAVAAAVAQQRLSMQRPCMQRQVNDMMTCKRASSGVAAMGQV
jgi:hypothetical protein